MGIWNEAKLICGNEIELSLDLLKYVKRHDSNFTVKFTEDPNHGDDNNEIYKCKNKRKNKDKGGQQLYDIQIVLNKWLEEHFSDITIEDTSPWYDCDYNEKRYYLAYKLAISETEAKTSINDMITTFANLNIDNYKAVFEILCPEDEYQEPKIFAVPHIW